MSILATIRWCPIFPKWDIYQSLNVSGLSAHVQIVSYFFFWRNFQACSSHIPGKNQETKEAVEPKTQVQVWYLRIQNHSDCSALSGSKFNLFGDTVSFKDKYADRNWDLVVFDSRCQSGIMFAVFSFLTPWMITTGKNDDCSQTQFLLRFIRARQPPCVSKVFSKTDDLVHRYRSFVQPENEMTQSSKKVCTCVVVCVSGYPFIRTSISDLPWCGSETWSITGLRLRFH